jgi:hypothetical protein
LHLLLAGFVGLILGCLLGGVFVGGLAMVASHHDGYRRHHQYQRDRDDWGPGGGYRPGQPGQRPLPQPTQS